MAKIISNEILPIRKDSDGNINVDYYATKSNIVAMSDNPNQSLDDRIFSIEANSNLAICDTGASNEDKIAKLDGYILSNSVIYVKFTSEVIESSTLNVNSTGAKPIYYKNSAITSGIIKAGDIAQFIYDGTNYNLISTDSIGQEGSAARVEGTILIL